MFNVRFVPRFACAENAGLDWPNANISETDVEYVFNFDIPGTMRDDIKIWLDNDLLTVSGEKKTDSKDKVEQLVSERTFGKFERSFRLPKSVDRNKVEAELINGVLTIKLPKIIETREISVK